jgi:hypothetical protein
MGQLITINQPNKLTTINPNLGQQANAAASHYVFRDYQSTLAENTLARHGRDLSHFSAYLVEIGAAVGADQLMKHPDAWRGVTWGIVEGFKLWLLKRGFSISTVNGCLSTVRSYARLA